MSLKDRFVDGVSSLVDKLNDGDGVTGIDEAELERELAKRSKGRAKAGNPKANDNPVARMAGAGSKAKEQRRALAKSRVAKIHGERARRDAAKKRDEDAAFRQMADEARRAPPPSRPRPSANSSSQARPPSSGGQRRRSPGAGIFGDKELAQHYKTLGVSPDADAGELKTAYRKLMRKYHPDLHQDARKKKAATELATKISVAYAAIEKSQK